MAFEKMDPQPAPRAEEDLAPDRYDARAPGLYPGETAYRLDGGDLVAVSVDQLRAENGAGTAFHGCARWIDEDGTTHICQRGLHVEASATANPLAIEIAAHGTGAFARDVALILLGEAPQTLKAVPDGEGGTAPHPILALDAEAAANASIVNAIAAAKETAPQADLGALLSGDGGGAGAADAA